MPQHHHIIHEQILDLQFTTQAAAESWQTNAGQFYRNRILPLIENYCNELCDEDTLVRLDTLELDLGELDAQRINLDFEEKIRPLLKSKLEEAIQKENRALCSDKKSVKTVSQRELLDTFIRTGYLPWWADKQDPKLLHRSLHHILTYDAETWKPLLASYLKSENYFKRLLYHFSDADFVEMSMPIARILQTSVHPLFEDIKRLSSNFPAAQKMPIREVRQAAWSGIFHALLSGEKEETAFTRRVLLHIMAIWRISYQTVVASISEVEKSGYSFESRLSDIAKEQDEISFQRENVEPLQKNTPPQYKDEKIEKIEPSQGDTPHQYKSEKEELTNEILKKSMLRNEAAQASERRDLEALNRQSPFNQSDELHINNAGLALLSTFLPRFFENLGLLKGKKFIDEGAPHKAITLLQYLVDGSTEPPEYMLPLNKILCGLPLETVYEAEEAALSESDFEQAAIFIEAVLEYAKPALGKISPEGFRNTFLRRSGLLSFEDGHWMLRVERETYDIVLDRLPWSFRIIKLPWMDYAIYVEW